MNLNTQPNIIPDLDVDNWPTVECNGVLWAVSPVMWAPIAIGDAKQVAEAYGCEVPTEELVMAIHSASHVKLSPLLRNHDGTPATMSSNVVYEDQKSKILSQLNALGLDFASQKVIITGTHKDIIQDDNGKCGIFGWSLRADGTWIQPAFFGHGGFWCDYSQGLRLCKKIVYGTVEIYSNT